MTDIDTIIRGLDGSQEVSSGILSSYTRPLPSLDQINSQLEHDFLTPSKELSWSSLDIFQTKQLDLLAVDEPSPRAHFTRHMVSLPPLISKTSTRFKRKGIAGGISSYDEVYDTTKDSSTSSNSLSLTRKVDSHKSSSIKGDTRNLPFQPGGLVSALENEDEKKLVKNDQGYYYMAPGLSRGLDFFSSGAHSSLISSLDSSTLLDAAERDTLELQMHSVRPEKPKSDSSNSKDVIDILVPDLQLQETLLTRKPLARAHRHEFAHMVDLDHKIENFEELVPNMARTWPFELDTFQKEAVFHLEQGDSVFVAAHTSAGKTVVAEYAIAMANRNMTKCIYTSPIKALSNQKFRDFKNDGQDVGLITGDVQINPESNCLIMTTEILRSMLYRGADLIRDVEFVIFDEVHYVNDIDRGVVWEEVIIMLPDHIKFILLSATVPNTFEFASWIGRTKQKDIYVISTPKRPVPLEISIWAKKDLFKVVDAAKNFDALLFKKHAELLEKPKADVKAGAGGRGGARGGRGGGARGSNLRGGRGGSLVARPGQHQSQRVFQRDGPNKSSWINIVRYLEKQKLLPVVVFVFSKKRCEEYCDTLSTIEFTNHKEKSEIHLFINKSVSMLKKEDRELPQILKIRDMLSRGILVHHGGLLPIVKECIEILFARGLVKVLFATETFAMGLNLPTRTVIFSELRKHDGRGFRNLLPGEFIQMAGRAGRRGLDSTGTVVVMLYNQPLQQEQFKEVTLGTPTKLQSQFRLTYNMILNLLRVELLRVEEMIKRSFSENTTQSLLPEHEKSIVALEKKLSLLVVQSCSSDIHCSADQMQKVYNNLVEYRKVNTKLIGACLESTKGRFVFKTGRMVIFRDSNNGIRPGFVVRVDFSAKKFIMMTFDTEVSEENKLELPYLCNIPGFVAKFFKKMKFHDSELLTFVEVSHTEIEYVSSYCLKLILNQIINEEEELISELKEEIHLLLRFQRKWREYDFKKSSTIQLHELLAQKKTILDALSTEESLNLMLNCPDFNSHFEQLNEKHKLQEQIKSLKSLVSDENLELLPDYEQRLAVLKSLGFVDENLNVVLKGRVACEVNSGWELALTELLLDNFLTDFTSEEIVALLSVFVYEGKTNDEEEIVATPRLDKGKAKIKEIMANLLKVYEENQVPLTQEEEEFLERKRFNLINVVYEWSRGMSFNDIMKISSELEGTIVRVITRLDEICREVKNALLIIGDNSLHAKMSEAQEKIKRDIVFCASLYL